MSEENLRYLGDGAYIEFDGHGFILRTGDHREFYCTNNVYLEPEVYRKLVNFCESKLKLQTLYLSPESVGKSVDK